LILASIDGIVIVFGHHEIGQEISDFATSWFPPHGGGLAVVRDRMFMMWYLQVSTLTLS
jgi:hypothetical protein